MKAPENNWDPAHFEQVLEQRAIDAAIQGCIDRLNAEYAKHKLTFPQAPQDKVRLRTSPRQQSPGNRYDNLLILYHLLLKYR